MKKIFTCISLAAATFMATTPVMAQQQKQLTDKEKAAVVKVIVPAVFDQVKQISIKPTCRSIKSNLGYS